jgi:hypothetical protein
VYRSLLFTCALIFCGATAWSKPFDFKSDTFAFKNQTYYDYKVVSATEIEIIRRHGKVPDFSRHCFQMCRAVVQFYKFAVFRPDLAKVSDPEYGEIVRKISRIPVWSSGPTAKIAVPGYNDLRSFSLGEALVIQKNLGLWWPSYWRIGNWRIVFPVPRAGQERIAKWLRNEIEHGRIQTVYITRLRPINHCLVAYHFADQPSGDIVFDVYDVNQPGKVVHLTYRSSDRSFYFDKTWYYHGGLVSVMKLFAGPLY